MVRLATIEDVPELVALGNSFVEQSQYRMLITPDNEAITNTMSMLIRMHAIFVLGRPIVGMLGIATYPHVWNGETCACEMFWWVEPQYRGGGVRMLYAAEKWAEEKGAKFIQMIQPQSEPRLGEIYERLGYVPIERQYQKRLGGKQ
jgi:GNAT superfamily N-acetyltransferase